MLFVFSANSIAREFGSVSDELVQTKVFVQCRYLHRSSTKPGLE
jgi:hypothetical protein